MGWWAGGAKLKTSRLRLNSCSLPRKAAAKLLQFVFYKGITARCLGFTLGPSVGEVMWDYNSQDEIIGKQSLKISVSRGSFAIR